MRATATVRQGMKIAAFFLISAGLCFFGGSSAINMLYPVAALLLALDLYFRDHEAYVLFTMLLWIFSPEVRRLVDFHTAYHPISPVIIAPILATSISLWTSLRYGGALTRRRCFPFVLCAAATVYALFIGALHNALEPTLYQFASWVAPIAWGLDLAIHAPQSEALWRSFDRALIWGGAIAGTYGIFQFLMLPPWDAYWIQHADLNSDGLAWPTAFRDFGTMNSPGPFGLYEMAALLLIGAAPTWRRTFAAAPIFLSFLLTLVRSAWLGLLLGIIILVLRAAPRQRMRLVLCACVVPLLGLPLLTLPVVNNFVGSRIATFNDLQQDTSFEDRRDFLHMFLDHALDEVEGEGFGDTGLATKLNHGGLMGKYGNFDNGVLELLFVLGWPGIVMFGTGFATLLFMALSPRVDAFAPGAFAIAIAVGAQLIGSNTIVAGDGMLFWSALGAAAATVQNRAARPGPRVLPRSRPVRLPLTGHVALPNREQ